MARERTVFGGYEEVDLRDGRPVRLEVSRASLTLRVGEERAALPYPRAGYGGHEVLASPDEEHVVLWMYSGQSQVGYELFALEPLRHVASFPYVVGDGGAPVFSPDARSLALAWTTNGGLVLDELALDDEDRTVAAGEVEWLRMRVVDLPDVLDGIIVVRVRVPAQSYYESDDSFEAQGLEVTDTHVSVRAPWGVEIRVARPLGGDVAVLVDGPAFEGRGPPLRRGR